MDSAMFSRTCLATDTRVDFWTDDLGERWGQAKSLFHGLGLSATNITVTLERHVFPEYRRQIAVGRGQPAWYLNYEGIIQLGMSAKGSKAQSFQRWVFGVIKEVVTKGGYETKPEDLQVFATMGLGMQLVAQAIELGRSTGLEPERILHLHRQASGEPNPIAMPTPAQVATQIKHRRPSKLVSDEDRLYQLRKVSAKFGGSASAREVAQFCKAAGSSIETKKWLYDLVGKGLASAEMVGRCQRFKVL